MARDDSFNELWASTGEKTDLDSFTQRVRTGWEGGPTADAPPEGQQNRWQYRADQALQDLERYGAMSWNSDARYMTGAPVYAEDANFYESLVDQNTGNNPVNTTGFWRLVGSSLFGGAEPGDLKTVAHNGSPSAGWLKCNGAVVSRAAYPRLFAKIGTLYNTGSETTSQFRLPDFRGEFLRGFDDGRGVDANRTMGTQQQGSSVVARVGNDGTQPGLGQVGVMNGEPGLMNTTWTPAYNAAQQARGMGEISYTVRPRNMPVNYWIRY